MYVTDFSSLYHGIRTKTNQIITLNIEITKNENGKSNIQNPSNYCLSLSMIYVLCYATYPDDKDPLN